jgi:hypothetical protein
MRQPSLRLTLPLSLDKKRETFETVAGLHMISGMFSSSGTAANGLTERQYSTVKSDICCGVVKAIHTIVYREMTHDSLVHQWRHHKTSESPHKIKR